MISGGTSRTDIPSGPWAPDAAKELGIFLHQVSIAAKAGHVDADVLC